MQAKGIQLAALESRVSGVLEASAQCGIDQWDRDMCHPGD